MHLYAITGYRRTNQMCNNNHPLPEMKHKLTPFISVNKRKNVLLFVYVIDLFIFSAGTACMKLTNDKMSSALEAVPSASRQSFDELENFVTDSVTVCPLLSAIDHKLTDNKNAPLKKP